MPIKNLFLVLICFSLLTACQDNFDKDQSGEQIAKEHCASCHLFPEPSLLDTATWGEGVLPVMAKQFGIYYFGGEPYQNDVVYRRNSKNNSAKQPLITLTDWKKIMKYYAETAPARLPPQARPPIQNFTDLFVVKKGEVLTDNSPSLTYIKIDEGNHWIYTGKASDSTLTIYNNKLETISKHDINGILIDMQFNVSLQKPGERSGIFTNIGIMNPNDRRTGTANTFHIDKKGSVSFLKQVLNKMPRPVQTTVADLDNDGKQDYLVCGFGYTMGALYWMKNEGDGKFEQRMLRPLPGAIKVCVDDYNRDGLQDIMALMAQAQEGIYLFTNKGNGNFDTKVLLQFPPVYGSSYFELDDFNNDGYKDILYTCGDNADYSSSALKNFHGVYIFLNDGKDNYVQKYFFPIHGCYKAIARDFDKDGDLDIATISFFPDLKNQPQESFVYLENKGNFQFLPYTIKEFNEGHWLTMDVGDIDGDGDDDIVLGSFVLPKTNSMSVQNQTGNPSFLLLGNQITK